MNKHLLNAIRYLDAVHDIQIKENHPKLTRKIEGLLSTLESDTLNNYWKLYIADIGSSVSDEQMNDSEVVEYEEKTIYYRGNAQTVKVKKSDSKKNDSKKAELSYRGSKS